MVNLIQNNITDAVIERFEETPDPRLKEILTSLVEHLHAFARDVNRGRSPLRAGRTDRWVEAPYPRINGSLGRSERHSDHLRSEVSYVDGSSRTTIPFRRTF